MEDDETINKIPRRQFLLWWLIPLAGATGIVLSFKSVYSGSINTLIAKFDPKSAFRLNRKNKKPKNRQTWLIESLILNLKTKVIHYPTKSIFTYYDKIADNHALKLEFENWKTDITPPNRLILSKSGIIIEKLALKEFTSPVSDLQISAAMQSIELAYSPPYNHENIHNWRIHELFVQLIALNTSISNEDKWTYFTKRLDLSKSQFIKVPKRDQWMRSKSEFEKRILYIQKNKTTYLNRLANRKI